MENIPEVDASGNRLNQMMIREVLIESLRASTRAFPLVFLRGKGLLLISYNGVRFSLPSNPYPMDLFRDSLGYG